MSVSDNLRHEHALIEAVVTAACRVVAHWDRGDYSAFEDDDLTAAVHALNDWRTK